MPSGHRNAAIKHLRSRYGAAWDVNVTPVGIELKRVVAPELTQHVFFNFVRDDLLGLRIQPALGVTFPKVNAIRDSISPPHQFTIDGVTALLFLNDVLDPSTRKNGGWLFEAGASLQPAFGEFLEMCDETTKRVGFFESLWTVDSYIRAIESGRWQFVTVMPAYLYALVATGDVKKAKTLAGEQRARLVKAAADKGYVRRDSDTQPYDEILRMQG